MFENSNLSDVKSADEISKFKCKYALKVQFSNFSGKNHQEIRASIISYVNNNG